MNLDPQHYYVENIQYRLTIAENSSQILNLLQTYIKEGGMKELLSNHLVDFPGEYMDEFITTQIKDIYFDIFVFFNSKNDAIRVINEMDIILNTYVQELKRTYGEFDFKEVGHNSYTEASLDITNNKSARLDTLRNLQVAYADYEQRLINYKTNKANYIKNYEPTVILSERSLVSFIIEYSIIGIFSLIIIIIIVYTIHYTFDDRIIDTKYLEKKGLPVFNQSSSNNLNIEESLLQLIELRHRVNDVNHFLFRDMDGDFINEITKESILSQISNSENMKRITLQFTTGFDLSVAKKLSENECCIIGVKKKKSTYGNLEKLLNEAKEFAIPIGGIVF